jgi:hypothetical protein
MLGVLNSLRDTMIRYVMNSQPITTDAGAGASTLDVKSARKFFIGEQVVIRNSTEGEIHTIIDIPDGSTLVLDDVLVQGWTVADGTLVEKAFVDQYVKRIYVGDPDVIPDFPAIVITCDSRDEEWWTINSTIQNWNCTIACLYEDNTLETTYESMLALTKSVEDALWANRMPIFGILSETLVTSDVSVGDSVISVADTSGIIPGHLGFIEDQNATQIIEVSRVIDGTTLEVVQEVFDDYTVADDAIVIIPSRWVMWTYPKGTEYGYIHKETLLKASQVKWHAQEEVVRFQKFVGPVKL